MTNKLTLRRRHIMLPKTALAEGRIASFHTTIPRELRGITAQITPLQTGSGDPSPTTVRPITGWSGLTVKCAGHNQSPVGTFTYPTDGTVCVIAENLTPGLTYNASAHRDSVTTTGSGIRIRFQYDIGGETIYDPGGYGSTGWMTKSCAVPDGATNVRVAIQRASAVSAYSISDIQLEFGDTRTDYEPYRDVQTVPVSWQTDAGTVYGGSLDLLTGVLTVTHSSFTFTPSMAWTVLTTNPGGTVFRRSKGAAGGVFVSPSSDAQWNAMEVYNTAFKKTRSRTVAAMDVESFFWNQTYFHFCTASCSTEAQFQTLIADMATAGTPLMLVAPLIAPLTYQLTPAQMAALAGENNVWTDVGDISVIYRA